MSFSLYCFYGAVHLRVYYLSIRASVLPTYRALSCTAVTPYKKLAQLQRRVIAVAKVLTVLAEAAVSSLLRSSCTSVPNRRARRPIAQCQHRTPQIWSPPKFTLGTEAYTVSPPAPCPSLDLILDYNTLILLSTRKSSIRNSSRLRPEREGVHTELLLPVLKMQIPTVNRHSFRFQALQPVPTLP